MQANSRRAFVVLLACLMLSACNLPISSGPQGTPNPTDYVMTLSALQTRAVMTATSQGVSGAPTQAPIPVSGGTPGTQAVVVLNDTLCWQGPGPAYETISALFKGTQVQLLGRTVLPAWYIVRDPIYQDPCWVQAGDLQVDQSLLPQLPVYPAPIIAALPTATPKPPSSTPTPSVSSPTPGLITATPLPPTLPPGTPTPPPPTAALPTPTPGSASPTTQPPPTAGSTSAPTATP